MKKIILLTTVAAICLMASCTNSGKKDNADAAVTDSTATTENFTIAEQVYLVGTMADNECQIELVLQNDGNNHCAGYVLYPESDPTLVAGWWDFYIGDDGGDTYYHNIRLTEYQKDGTITGRFNINLTIDDESDEFDFSDAERTYISHDEEEEDTTAPIIDVTCSSVMPEWFTESPFIPANYDDIAKHYFYNLYGPDAYGEVLIEKTGNGQLTFNAEDNRDDGSCAHMFSEEGRPAQVKDNIFEYKDANDCGYTLIATFYKNFCVMETRQVPSDQTNCSFINAYFIRQEQ